MTVDPVTGEVDLKYESIEISTDYWLYTPIMSEEEWEAVFDKEYTKIKPVLSNIKGHTISTNIINFFG